ncbi:hypothetical protein WJX74_000611 [Apatococcus lobatus]|uniref:C3H1-type domain-containing protein n=1 Tax=Apatococcus lobatus TaxID=904363 RepID=A0AAW1SDD7_9CHLO
MIFVSRGPVLRQFVVSRPHLLRETPLHNLPGHLNLPTAATSGGRSMAGPAQVVKMQRNITATREDQRKKIPCRFMEHCSNPNCVFNHDAPKAKPTPKPSGTQVPQMCHFHQKGFCKFGDACRSFHDEEKFKEAIQKYAMGQSKAGQHSTQQDDEIILDEPVQVPQSSKAAVNTQQQVPRAAQAQPAREAQKAASHKRSAASSDEGRQAAPKRSSIWERLGQNNKQAVPASKPTILDRVSRQPSNAALQQSAPAPSSAGPSRRPAALGGPGMLLNRAMAAADRSSPVSAPLLPAAHGLDSFPAAHMQQQANGQWQQQQQFTDPADRWQGIQHPPRADPHMVAQPTRPIRPQQPLQDEPGHGRGQAGGHHSTGQQSNGPAPLSLANAPPLGGGISTQAKHHREGTTAGGIITRVAKETANQPAPPGSKTNAAKGQGQGPQRKRKSDDEGSSGDPPASRRKVASSGQAVAGASPSTGEAAIPSSTGDWKAAAAEKLQRGRATRAANTRATDRSMASSSSPQSQAEPLSASKQPRGPAAVAARANTSLAQQPMAIDPSAAAPDTAPKKPAKVASAAPSNAQSQQQTAAVKVPPNSVQAQHAVPQDAPAVHETAAPVPAETGPTGDMDDTLRTLQMLLEQG